MAERKKFLYDETPFDANRPFEVGGWRKLPEIVHDDFNIKGFFGDFCWLSNFGEAKVQLDGVMYTSVEIAYQAAKHAPQDRDYFLSCSSKESITFNRENIADFYTPEAWDGIKVVIMRYLLEQKYDPELNPEMAQKLLDTGTKYIEETNWWGDEFWGKSLNGEGLNTLGVLTMEIRDNLRT